MPSSKYKTALEDPGSKLVEVLSPDELGLFGYPGGSEVATIWKEITEFKANALDLWGLDWERHVPHPDKAKINILFQYLFGIVLWWYQLKVVYSPFSSVLVRGARGCGKTIFLALLGAIYTAFRPGGDWLAAAPTVDQVMKQHQAVLEMGLNDPEGKRDFRHLFIVDHAKHPHGRIDFRSWDQYDTGNTGMFRTVGKPNEPGELLRSTEAQLVTLDEMLRDFPSDWAVRVLQGCLRGLNNYKANREPELRNEWQKMGMRFSVEMDFDKRDKLEEEMDQFTIKNHLAKDILTLVAGNAGYPLWPYVLEQRASKGERPWYAPVWLTRDNPAYTKTQRLALEEKYADDPELLAMETEAKRPPPPGTFFTVEQMELLFDSSLDAELMDAVYRLDEDGKPDPIEGYDHKKHRDHGTYKLQFPGELGRMYLGGADGGTYMFPYRGKWVILIADVTEPPYPIVYFESGNLDRRNTGSMEPWLTRLYQILSPEIEPFYTIPRAGLYTDATGLQKDVYELAATWDAQMPVQIYGFEMSQKIGLIAKTQVLLSRGMFRSPMIEQWELELGTYTMPDKEPMAQDIVMALLALTQAVWDIKGQELQKLLGPERIKRLAEKIAYRKRQAAEQRYKHLRYGRHRELRHAR